KIVHVDTAARGVDEPPRAYSAFYLSLKDSIERYLNMKHILPYIQFPRPSEQNIIDSCLCGLQYKTLYNKYKKFLAVNIYIDDVSLNTPIGSYSDNNGITNVSYSIPNVVRNRSTLDNIRPFIVTLSEHAKKNSYQEILKIIINEFEGLEVRVGEEMIPCKLFMLKGDNLAINSILKLSGSFSPKSATNQCRLCLCTYDQFQDHLSSSRIPTRMIRLESPNELLKFPLNRSLDPFHDLHEGVVPQITFLLIRRGVQQGVFSTRAFYNTAVEISKQLRNHTKFHDSLNSPENITWHINNTDVTKKTTLRLSGSQSVTLLYALPVIFDRICLNGFNMEKKLTSKLIDIVKYCSSNTMEYNQVDLLDSSVTDFLHLLKNMEPSFTISIKFHNLCHYKLMIESFGLPKSWSCEREESTNAVLKQLVLISKNRVNVPKTCFRKIMQRKRILEMLIESDPDFDPSNQPVVATQVTKIIGSDGKTYEIE
uniref:Reverse transcriptase domain-containing protein n=1 Tax=Strongyloides papillosus TaxID=174720 RepID=A0A0N5C1Q3_STREA